MGSKFHALMYSWFASGHMIPFLHLANKLAEKGHRVTFLLPKKALKQLEHLDRYPHNIVLRSVTVPHVDGLPVGTETASEIPVSSSKLLVSAMDLTCDQVTDVVRAVKPDLIFFDFAHWIPEIAREFGVKTVNYLLLSAAMVASLTVSLGDMEEDFIDLRRPRKKTGVTNEHHYKVNCLYVVLDLQLQEFNNRFNEVNTELLICAASLSPIDSFSQFDQSKLMRLSTFYPSDFTPGECISLEQQLDIYIDNIRNDDRFTPLKDLGELARMLVETRKHMSFPLVYRLLKLVLILHVGTATLERCFSAMKIVKTDRRNRMGNQFWNNCLVCFVEKDVFDTITNETVLKRFQDMKDGRVVL